MEKIAIIGCPGAGKSTIAVQIASLLNIEVVHLGAIFWKPNWVPTPKLEWEKIVQDLIEKK